jgi:hypothetical protein
VFEGLEGAAYNGGAAGIGCEVRGDGAGYMAYILAGRSSMRGYWRHEKYVEVCGVLWLEDVSVFHAQQDRYLGAAVYCANWSQEGWLKLVKRAT